MKVSRWRVALMMLCEVSYLLAQVRWR